MSEITITESPQQTADYVMKMWANSRTYFKRTRDEWLNAYKRYMSILDVDTTASYYRWRSKLFIPATARAVDGLLPDILLTLFAPDPFFEAAPREPNDIDQANAQTSALMYQFEKNDIFLKSYDYIKQWGMYGTTFGKVYWTKKSVTEHTPMQELQPDGSTKAIRVPRQQGVIDQPWFEPLDAFAMAWNPKATSLEESWVCQRSEKTLREMKNAKDFNGKPLYENIGQIENLIMRDRTEGRYEDIVKRSFKGLTTPYSGDEGDDRKIELIEYWNQPRTKTCTVAAGQVLVRPMRDNPFGYGYDPYLGSNMWGNPFELLGQGIPKKCEALQDQLNSEVNQRLDNRSLRQNLIFKVRRGANINTRNLISRPGNVWLTDDMTALEVLNIPDISTPYSFQEENMLEMKCEEITGVTRYATGAGSNNAARTATEASILTRMTNKSFALHLKILEDSFIKPMVRKFMYLNSKFIERDMFVRIVGNPNGYQFIKISPDDLRKTDFDILVYGASQLTDKNMKQQQMVQYMQIIGADPDMAGWKHELHRRIWENWGNKDFDIIQQKAMEAQLAKMRAMAQMQAAAPQVPGATGGVPQAPTGLRLPSANEGVAPIALGGGGEAPGYQ